MAQISGADRVCQYTASAGQTTFIYDFKIYDDDEIIVQQNGTVLTLTTDYTVTDAGEEVGGTVVLNSGATLNDQITLTGNTIVARDTVFTNGGAYEASAINDEYDKLDNMVSEIVTEFGKTLKLTDYDAAFDTTITPTADRAIKINSAGDGFEMSTYDPDEQVGDAAASAAAALASENAAAASEAAAEISETNAATSAAEAAVSAASINNAALGTDIIPDTDDTRDLGSATKAWAEIHCEDAYVGDDLDVTDDASIGGDLSVTGGVTVNTDKFTIAAATGNTAIDGTLTVGGEPISRVQFAEYRHQVAYNVEGGAATGSYTWTKRPIDTETADEIGITLASSVLTLPAGDYVINCYSVHKAPAYCKLRLRQTSGTPATLVEGIQRYITNTENAIMNGMFTIADDDTTVELQYNQTNAVLVDGLGEASEQSAMGDNIYCQIVLERY